ncbi:MST1 [[Candida] subhashii]|uniref:threonine--tRNA ligase n=1 Tax=[Candida] subhashii TaxID=561895 RepID=A0A8J5QH59_9ASCO|nr:MST1 [[Candida] subhashii]KAG7664611.1 MST1 [[Candida] subhashii]
MKVSRTIILRARCQSPQLSLTRFYSQAQHTQPHQKEPISSTQANKSIAVKQELYTTDPTSPGSIFFLPHGTRIINTLVTFMKNQQTRYGFQEVITPLIYKTKLWEKSGHWENYKEDMFKVIGNDPTKEEQCHHEEGAHEYGLKPMNCPGHCLIFSKFDRSYNELPVRFSDFSSLHRNEASGALSGLTRVRRFHQDDGHIFCDLSQIDQEIKNTINLIKDTYGVFGIGVNDIEFFLSTRPEDKFMGDIETWNNAEEQLKQVLNSTAGEGKWEIREGDGAFYGPKIDVLLTDAFQKKHQVGTIQLDFQLPARFELKYIGEDGARDHQPILVHRAVFGSLERFLAILIDHYQGKWPFWINPRQAIIVPVNDTHHSAAEALKKKLSGDILDCEGSISPITGHNFFVDVDTRSETVGNRVKEAISKGYSYIIMLGDKDIQSGKYAIRSATSRKVTSMTPDEIYQMFIDLEKTFK